MALVGDLKMAWSRHEKEALAALAMLESFGGNLPRVPGCDTSLRLAHRIYCGRSTEQAAAREYVYRWSLAIDAFASHVRTGGRPNPFASHYAPHAFGL